MSRTKTVITLALLLSSLGASSPAAANHCPGTVTEVDSLYIWSDVDPAGETYFYLYLESNGEPGLQQDNRHPLEDVPLLAFYQMCGHANPDTMVPGGIVI